MMIARINKAYWAVIFVIGFVLLGCTRPGNTDGPKGNGTGILGVVRTLDSDETLLDYDNTRVDCSLISKSDAAYIVKCRAIATRPDASKTYETEIQDSASISWQEVKVMAGSGMNSTSCRMSESGLSQACELPEQVTAFTLQVDLKIEDSSKSRTESTQVHIALSESDHCPHPTIVVSQAVEQASLSGSSNIIKITRPCLGE